MTRIRPIARLLPLTALPLLSLGLSDAARAGTWTVAKDNMATVLMGVDFVDQSNGYVVGGDNASGGSVIFHTGDGGRTWLNQQDNPLQCAMYLDIALGDANHAIAGGLGMFYRFAGGSYTADGRTWHASKDRWLASAYQDVDAVDAEHMFMIGVWEKISHYGYGVAASSDGGHTFTYYDWGIDTAARYGSFVSPTVGYVSGKGANRISQHVRVPGRALKHDPREGLTYDGYRGTIARTSDGGQTWEVLYDDYDRFYFNGIDFVDEQNGWAVAEGDAGAWILHTADGGLTWDEQHFEDGGSLLQIRMIDANEGWAVGAYIGVSYKALFLHTTDGGATWTPVDTGLGKYYIFNLDFADKDHGFAVALNPGGAGSVLKFAP
jgi:photosystem II stability/assembly factor-like uncharacterized protein